MSILLNLENCTDLKVEDLELAINELINYSLISRNPNPNKEEGDLDSYKMLPLTRVFAYKKLANKKNLERKTLKRYNSYIQKQDQFRSDLKTLKTETKLAGLNQKQKDAYLKALKAVEFFEDGDYPGAYKLFRDADQIADDVPEVYYLWGNIEMKLGHLRMTDELFEKATNLNKENPTYW